MAGTQTTERATTPTWEERSRIVVSPVSAPSVLGLIGFAAATAMVAAHEAGFWGQTGQTELPFIAFFALAFGGIAQFLAGMWSYKARDVVATAAHGMWGAFWIGYGLVYFFISAGTLSEQAFLGDPFGVVLLTWGLITLAIAAAALLDNWMIFAVLFTLGTGAATLGGGLVWQVGAARTAGAWLLVGSAALAVLAATAMAMAETAGKVILPLGKYDKKHNRPGAEPTSPIEYDSGMPGSRVGQ